MGPPNGCFSPAIIQVVEEPPEIHPVAFLLPSPAVVAGAGAVPSPAVSERLRIWW